MGTALSRDFQHQDFLRREHSNPAIEEKHEITTSCAEAEVINTEEKDSVPMKGAGPNCSKDKLSDINHVDLTTDGAQNSVEAQLTSKNPNRDIELKKTPFGYSCQDDPIGIQRRVSDKDAWFQRDRTPLAVAEPLLSEDKISEAEISTMPQEQRANQDMLRDISGDQAPNVQLKKKNQRRWFAGHFYKSCPASCFSFSVYASKILDKCWEMDPSTEDQSSKTMERSQSDFNDCHHQTSKKKSTKRKKQCLLSLTIVFMTLSIALASATMIIGFSMMIETNEGKAYRKTPLAFYEEQPVCMSCHGLVQNPSELKRNPLIDQLIRSQKDGTEMCCAQSANSMSALLRLVVRRRVSRLALAAPVKERKFMFSPVSAHKRLLVHVNDTPEAGPQFFEYIEPLKFSQDISANEHRRGLEIGENAFIIPYTGYYYVYASLHFKPSTSSPGKDFIYSEFYGYIHRISPSRPAHGGVLTKIAHYVCDDCVDDQKTRFSGGAFKLYKGDKIQICTAGWNLMEFMKESSYAGLFMLASDHKD